VRQQIVCGQIARLAPVEFVGVAVPEAADIGAFGGRAAAACSARAESSTDREKALANDDITRLCIAELSLGTESL